jgi:hypothetical protein
MINLERRLNINKTQILFRLWFTHSKIAKDGVGHRSLVRVALSSRVLFPPDLSTWYRSLELKPGKEEVVTPQADIKITNIALGDVLSDASGRTTVKFTYHPPSQPDEDDEDGGENVSESLSTAVLCSLKPGTVRPQQHFKSMSPDGLFSSNKQPPILFFKKMTNILSKL